MSNYLLAIRGTLAPENLEAARKVHNRDGREPRPTSRQPAASVT